MPPFGAWWGVHPGAYTGVPKPKELAEFEQKIGGRSLDIVHQYHRGAQLFPNKKEIEMAKESGRNRLLFINWKPEMGRTWAEVAYGNRAVDRQIDKVADHIRKNFPEPFFLTIHHEPEDEVDPEAGSGYTAKDYRAMFRHVVTRLRAGGVDNAVIVMNFMGVPQWGVKPWFGDLYPGDDVVDWIAFDQYATGRFDDLHDLVDTHHPDYPEWPGFYSWAERHIPDKPIMLAEWGVFERKGAPEHKPDFYRTIIQQIQYYPRLKAMVYFDSPKAPRGDTRIDSTPAAARAYRDLSNQPYFDPPGPAYC